MLERLKRDVCQANLDLVKAGLVIQTWGNASGIDRRRGLVVIKPSGVSYDGMKPKHMVVVSLAERQSRRGPAQAEFGHCHPPGALPRVSRHRRHRPHPQPLRHRLGPGEEDLPSYGTTQADYCYGDVPCTRLLTTAELRSDYEANTGQVIVERFRKLDPMAAPRRAGGQSRPVCLGQGRGRRGP